MSQQPRQRRVICTATAETSCEVALLQRHGFCTTVTHAVHAADILLPAKGGSLAYLLWSGRTATQQLVERAAAAARAARRCTVLWVGPLDEWVQFDELQAAVPAGVTVLRCERPEEAAEHILACEQRAIEDGGASTGPMTNQEELEIVDGVSVHLAELWGVDKHEVDFMLATVPLTQLARVRNEIDWEQLLAETNGLVNHELIFTAIEWLQRDQPQL